MHSVSVRLIIYILSPILGMVATILPGWGIAYADGIVSIHIETLATAAVGAVVGAATITPYVFAKWGTK
jgi:hypothetical protein